MNSNPHTDPDADITRRAMLTHRQSTAFARKQLATLTSEQKAAIAYDAIYFATSARITLTYPEAEVTDYVRGYIQATADILEGAGIDLKLTSITKLD